MVLLDQSLRKKWMAKITEGMAIILYRDISQDGELLHKEKSDH